MTIYCRLMGAAILPSPTPKGGLQNGFQVAFGVNFR
jgi:hypothetical protein